MKRLWYTKGHRCIMKNNYLLPEPDVEGLGDAVSSPPEVDGLGDAVSSRPEVDGLGDAVC